MKENTSAKYRFRLLKAYSTALRILLSYGVARLFCRFIGHEAQIHTMNKAHVKNARRLKETILALEGLYIKVGQLISIMSNFFPEEFRKELEALQDKIPPRPYDEIATRLRNELGARAETLFKSIKKEPIASASLAQVHEAFLPDGQHVAVKIQYINIHKTAHQDLRTIQRILKIVGFIFGIKGIDISFRQVKEMIMAELDFLQEAQHIGAIAANFEDDPDIKFPTVIPEYSTSRVLTTTFMEGVKATDLAYLDTHGIDREALAKRIITAYCQMIFNDGTYHADPHPGNLLVQPDGTVVFVDFGAVARLSPEMKEGIPRFLEGVLKRDKAKITDALRLMGFIAYDNDDYAVETIIDYIYGRFLQELSLDSWSLKDIQVDLETKLKIMGDFRRLNVSLRDLMTKVQIPKDWVLLERTIILLMGLCTHLEPKMNPMKTIQPYLQAFVLGQDRDWKEFVGSVIKDLAGSIFKMPVEMGRLLDKTNRGELEIRVKGLTTTTEVFYALGHQLLYALFCMVSGAMAFWAHLQDEVSLRSWFGSTSAIFAACLLLSMVRTRRKIPKRK